jgi:acetyl esterase/lipase
MNRTITSLLAFAMVVAACSPSSTDTTEAPTSPPTSAATTTADSSTTSSSTTTTSTTAPSTTTADTTAESLQFDYFAGTEEFHEGLELDVFAPADIGDWPVVVTVHGGGWYAGDRTSMRLLADGLAARNAVVFNISYSTGIRGGMFPGAVDDVACGIAYAAATADRFTTSPDRLFLVGHSAGAHMSSLVALDPQAFGLSCEYPVPQADGFVGLAGPYNVELLEFVLQPWFGVSTEEDPDIWALANPLTYADRAPAIPYLLIHGDADQIAPVAFSEQFRDSLDGAGADVRFELIVNAGHSEVNHPRLVGDMIAELWRDQ